MEVDSEEVGNVLNYEQAALIKHSSPGEVKPLALEMEYPDDYTLLSQLVHLQFNYSVNFNGTFNETDTLLPTGFRVTIVVVYMIVCLIGLVGNFLVMYVIIRYTKMKTATNIYIFNLALADSLFLATLPFQGTDVFLGFWPFGNALCKVVVSIDYYNMFTSTFTLTVMSMDRYVAVCHPVKALDMRTPHKAKVVNICVWVLASAFGVPAMFLGNVEMEPEHGRLNQIKMTATASDCPHIEQLLSARGFCLNQRVTGIPVLGTCVFLFSFLIPVAIISICYSLMVKRLRNVRILSGSKEKDRNLRRITRMVLVVVAAFVVCWTPVQIMGPGSDSGLQPEQPVHAGADALLHRAWLRQHSLNPVLYAFLDENFKRCFREFCNPSPFRLDTQQSGRMRSIAGRVAAAYSCKADGSGHGGGTSNPA
ncbi:hypothetical protein KUCAC02_012762 [Chaenocephalus aceratus]|uniref:Uncharacterized protein n=1 Tax=Chaenocephalus aceratus TaxID=36190 RepID=A0ACB9XDQ0_CHAAC|nr:hypothetical protein KUCAC02_012762 [Chaenocephalus aceratus]